MDASVREELPLRRSLALGVWTARSAKPRSRQHLPRIQRIHLFRQGPYSLFISPPQTQYVRRVQEALLGSRRVKERIHEPRLKLGERLGEIQNCIKALRLAVVRLALRVSCVCLTALRALYTKCLVGGGFGGARAGCIGPSQCRAILRAMARRQYQRTSGGHLSKWKPAEGWPHVGGGTFAFAIHCRFEIGGRGGGTGLPHARNVVVHGFFFDYDTPGLRRFHLRSKESLEAGATHISFERLRPSGRLQN